MDHRQQLIIAKETGYNDAKYDGIDTSALLECQCKECYQAYYEGMGLAIAEIQEDNHAD